MAPGIGVYQGDLIFELALGVDSELYSYLRPSGKGSGEKVVSLGKSGRGPVKFSRTINPGSVPAILRDHS